MPGNVRVGCIETDAVPGPVLIDPGFQEIETAPDAFPACIGKRPGGGVGYQGACATRRRRADGRRRIIKGLAQELE